MQPFRPSADAADLLAPLNGALVPAARWPWLRRVRTRRVLAILLDLLFLWIVGKVVGPVVTVSETLRLVGPLVGLAIALAYFGILGSSVGGGQTLGKRLLGLRVVDETGAAPRLGTALLRASLVATPLVLNTVGALARWPATAAFQAASFIILAPLLVLLPLINGGRGDQGPQDLLLGTHVVALGAEASPPTPRPWSKRIALAWGILVAGAVVWSFVGPKANAAAVAWRSLRDAHGLASLSVQRNLNRTFSSKGTTDSDILVITGTSVQSSLTFPQTAPAVAASVNAEFPEPLAPRFVVVSFDYGWDLGIAASHILKTATFRPPPPGTPEAAPSAAPGAP